MKKLFLFAAILFAGVSVVKADEPQSSDQTKLTVTLNTIQSISVGQDDVSIEYSTIEHYAKGNSSIVYSDHLNVYSTGGFDVKVKYDLDGVTSDSYTATTDGTYEGTAKSLFESIKAVVVDGTAEKGVNLTTGGLSLITSDTGGTDLKYNVRYDGAGGEYMNYTRANARTFVANVTYSIIPN